MQRFLARLENTKLAGVGEKITMMYFDCFAASADPDKEYEDMFTSAIFLAKMILPKAESNITTVNDTFAIWNRQTKEHESTKRYCAAYLVDCMCKAFTESIKGLLIPAICGHTILTVNVIDTYKDVDLFVSAKMYADPLDDTTAENSVLNESGFDNDTMISVRHQTPKKV